MKLYKVLLDQRKEMDTNLRKICGAILEQTFITGEDFFPLRIKVKNALIIPKEQLNKFLEKASLEATSIKANFEVIDDAWTTSLTIEIDQI